MSDSKTDNGFNVELRDSLFIEVGPSLCVYPGPAGTYEVRRFTGGSYYSGRSTRGFALYMRIPVEGSEEPQLRWIEDFATYDAARIAARNASEIL